MTTTQSKFYCNSQALTPEERAHHKQLTKKAAGGAKRKSWKRRRDTNLQFSPKSVSLAELADWVVAESKCCPFFDFHMELENEGSLLCLRLTGEEGIKAFIRAAFSVR